MTRLDTKDGYVLMIDWCPIKRATTAFVFEDVLTECEYLRKNGVVIHFWKESYTSWPEGDLSKAMRLFREFLKEEDVKSKLQKILIAQKMK